MPHYTTDPSLRHPSQSGAKSAFGRPSKYGCQHFKALTHKNFETNLDASRKGS